MGELLRLGGRRNPGTAAWTILVALVLSLPGTLLAQAPEEGKPEKSEKPEGEKSEKADAPAGAEGAKTPVPGADFWVLDFTMQKVATFQPSEGPHRGQTYWYMLYRIENKTGQDREAHLAINAQSDKKKTYGDTYLPDIEALIERKVGKPLWGKADRSQALKERAEKGEVSSENATFNYFPFENGKRRDCIAIFNQLDPSATKVTIAIEGLSNDLKLIHPEGGEKQIQSRVYLLELERPGDEFAMNLDRFNLVRRGWSKKLTALALPAKEG